MRAREIIQENALTRYLPMFNGIPEDIMARNSNALKIIFDTFKGNSERLTWALKWARVGMVDSALGTLKQRFSSEGRGDFSPEMDQEATTLLNLKKKFARGLDPAETALTDMDYLNPMNRLRWSAWKHWFGLPIPAIQNFQYGTKDIEAVTKIFGALEREYLIKYAEEREAKAELVTRQKKDEVLLRFPDGMKWVNLNRSGCEDEAEAMGHCGNGANHDHSTETIFSLRSEIDGEGGREDMDRPSLTFIFDRAKGSLGEMKGRANNKPSAKYHTYIMALLKLPMIKQLRGGGYAPENNFQFDDLTEEQQKEVLEANPDLELGYNRGCFGKINGKPFWIAAYNAKLKSGRQPAFQEEQYIFSIEATYDYWTAEDAGFEASHYMGRRAYDLVQKEQYFWYDGEIRFEDTDNSAERKQLIRYLKSIIEPIQ